MRADLDILRKNDPVLGKLIDMIGELELHKQDNYYLSLVKSIIGQQLSIKAAETIFSRFIDLTERTIIPEVVIMLSDEALRKMGISYRKINYIKDLSAKLLNKEITLETLDQLSDSEVINTLTSVKGIGVWTAEMFLIFSLGREDVLSILDVGLQRGAKWLYSTEDGKKALIDKGLKWEPYRSLASLYLWEAVNRGLVTSYQTFDDYYQHEINYSPS